MCHGFHCWCRWQILNSFPKLPVSVFPCFPLFLERVGAVDFDICLYSTNTGCPSFPFWMLNKGFKWMSKWQILVFIATSLWQFLLKPPSLPRQNTVTRSRASTCVPKRPEWIYLALFQFVPREMTHIAISLNSLHNKIKTGLKATDARMAISWLCGLKDKLEACWCILKPVIMITGDKIDSTG